MRLSKHEMYMQVANTVAKRSHDAQTQVGAVLVNNKTGAIIATGYNGFARGADDSVLPNTRPCKHRYIVHAEENLIANCARHGISMENCILYCTMSPCIKCMRLLWQCGITEIIVQNLYKDVEEIRNMDDIKINIEDNTNTFHGYYAIRYSV